jgi:RNA polymerase sigma-70 factor (ECF subfamily)
LRDEEIIRLIQKGDSQLYGTLIDRYGSKVYSTAYSYTHNHEEARDLVQEIFIKAFHSLTTFKLEAKFSTWLYRIAVNRCIDWSRKRKNKSAIWTLPDEEGNILDTLPDEEDNPEETLLREENKEAVRTAVDSLPEIYKTALILYYFEELPIQEISGILDCPKKTVETRLYRGRSLLKELLKQELSGGERYELQNL